MSRQLQVGDMVAWSAKFLRSIADYSHKSASARFKVLAVNDLGGGVVLLELMRQGDKKEVGGLITNFVKADELHKEAH